MKVLFEIPGSGNELTRARSHFNWLRNNDNKLFVLEDGRRMKIFSSSPELGQILYSENLNATRYCTALAWNKDGSILAMVIDRKKIFLLDLKERKTKQHKINNKSPFLNNKSVEIDFVVWSKLCDRFVVCYSTGQLSIGDFESEYPLKFVSKDEGALDRITSIECNYHCDVFVCLTKSHEVLVVNFAGETKLYWLSGQTESGIKTFFSVSKAKTSWPAKVPSSGKSISHIEYVWLACADVAGSLKFEKVYLNDNPNRAERYDQFRLEYQPVNTHSKLIDFDWLSSDKLILYYQTGILVLIKLAHNKSRGIHEYTVTGETVLDIFQDNSFVELSNSSYEQDREGFKLFELVKDCNHRQSDASIDGPRDDNDNELSFSMVAITNFEVFCYDICFTRTGGLVFEKIDELDHTGRLKNSNLRLHRAEWSYDSSMLALQLSNSHIIVYQTRIQNQIIASNGSRVAFVSGPNEVSVINLRPDMSVELVEEVESGSSSCLNQDSDQVVRNMPLIIRNAMKPSVIAVGPNNLAIALNNRVRFYSIASKDNGDLRSEELSSSEQEYVSIVIAMSINSRFVAIQFDDGRLKLHPIKTLKTTTTEPIVNENRYTSWYEPTVDFNERFFPDPQEMERITAFVLTKKQLLYSTEELTIRVFDLFAWSTVQNCDHSAEVTWPIMKLIPNEFGNKFACLTKETKDGSRDNAFIYDLFKNSIFEFFTGQLYDKIFKSQLNIELPFWPQIDLYETNTDTSRPKLNRIKDIVWDSDGHGITLVESKQMHNFTLSEHTLEREDLIVEYVVTAQKPTSYKAIWASQGIMCFQTGIGRGVHTLLEPYNDELIVTKLEQDVRSIKGSSAWNNENDQDALLSSLVEVARHKLIFIRKILPINSLLKCKVICENLVEDKELNLDKTTPYSGLIEQLLWRQLAARAIFTMNLEFASMIYTKYGQSSRAAALKRIIDDWRYKGQDSRTVIKTRLLVFLECD